MLQLFPFRFRFLLKYHGSSLYHMQRPNARHEHQIVSTDPDPRAIDPWAPFHLSPPLHILYHSRVSLPSYRLRMGSRRNLSDLLIDEERFSGIFDFGDSAFEVEGF